MEIIKYSEVEKNKILHEYDLFIKQFENLSNRKFICDNFTIEYKGSSKIKLDNNDRVDEFIFYENDNPDEIKKIITRLIFNETKTKTGLILYRGADAEINSLLTFINYEFTDGETIFKDKFYSGISLTKLSIELKKELYDSNDLMIIFKSHIEDSLNSIVTCIENILYSAVKGQPGNLGADIQIDSLEEIDSDLLYYVYNKLNELKKTEQKNNPFIFQLVYKHMNELDSNDKIKKKWDENKKYFGDYNESLTKGSSTLGKFGVFD